jgi:hypothetical protein
MQQDTSGTNKTIIEHLTYVANEYLLPVFTGTLAFAIIMLPALRITGEDSPLYGIFTWYEFSAMTAASTTGQIIVVLLIMAGFTKLASLRTPNVAKNKQRAAQPDKDQP